MTFKSDTTSSELARAKADNGLVIASLNPGGSAQMAGIQAGDVLEKIDGTAITNSEGAQSILASKKPGDYVFLLINRSGVRFERKVRLD